MDIHQTPKTLRNGAADLAEQAARTARDAGTTLKRGAQDAATGAKRVAEDVANVVGDTWKDGRDAAEQALDAGTDQAQEAGSRVTQVLRQAKDAAVSAKDTVLSTAGDALGHARDAAIGTADKAREGLSDVGDRLARNLEEASERAESPLGTRAYASAAQGVDAVAATLRDHSFAQLGADVGHLAKRHPAVFVAGAALLGFAAARALRHAADQGRGR